MQDEKAWTLQQILAAKGFDNLHPELEEDVDQTVADNIAYASLERQRPKSEPPKARSVNSSITAYT